MQDLARLSSLAEAELDELVAQGVKLTAADIIEINALGWAVESPESRLLLARGIPVYAGGVPLWPLTMQAADWFSRVGLSMKNPDAAMGYAMAHCYSEWDELYQTGAKAWKAVKAWYKGLHCTNTELLTAMHMVINQEERVHNPIGPNDKLMTPGEFSAFVASTCGGTPDFWERRCAVGYCHAMLVTIAAQNRADGKPFAGDPRMEAERAMGIKIEELKKAAVTNG